MKYYTFTMDESEAEVFDANIDLMCYAFPDLTREDAIKALVRRGCDDILQRLQVLNGARSKA